MDSRRAAHRAWWTSSPHSRPQASNSLGRLKTALEFGCEPVVAQNSDYHRKVPGRLLTEPRVVA